MGSTMILIMFVQLAGHLFDSDVYWNSTSIKYLGLFLVGLATSGLHSWSQQLLQAARGYLRCQLAILLLGTSFIWNNLHVRNHLPARIRKLLTHSQRVLPVQRRHASRKYGAASLLGLLHPIFRDFPIDLYVHRWCSFYWHQPRLLLRYPFPLHSRLRLWNRNFNCANPDNSHAL